MLSKNKQSFLDKRDFSTYQLSVSDYPSLINHYLTKHNIKIYLNGNTVHSEPRKALLDKQVKDLDDSEVKYGLYFVNNWCKPGFDGAESFAITNCSFTPFSEIYQKLAEVIKEFLDEKGALKKQIDIQKLNLILSEYFQSNPSLKDTFDTKIKEYQEALLDKKLGLSKQEVYSEIQFIQAELKEDECVGYIFTHGRKKDHFEVLILSKDKIIKPITWGMGYDNTINPKDFPFIYTKLDTIVKSETNQKGTLPLPQTKSDKFSCGTLGLLYLKELLKNKGNQLNKFSLCFQYRDEVEGVLNFFLPSPHVLRYSQSELYNKIIKAMMTDTNSIQIIEHKGEVFRVLTIKKLLEDTLKKEKPGFFSSGSVLYKDTKNLLNNLPDFIKNWTKEYEKVEANRILMTDKENEINVSLAYHAKKFEKKI